MSDGGDPAEACFRRVHEQFNASDSDVTMESADGVLFRLHTQNLKITTGAFPGSEFSTQGEPTPLAENADVLEIVFAYLYPKRHPNLANMEFSLLARIAEAVEKYDVFPAQNISEVRMREFIPLHAIDVLAHGVKHGYPTLINESALALSRLQSISALVTKISTTTLYAWIQYSESWKAIFERATETIQSAPSENYTHCFSYTGSGTLYLCNPCRLSLSAWVTKMEKIHSLPLLKTSLTPTSLSNFPGLVYCPNSTSSECPKGECIHMKTIAEVIQDGIDTMPPFEQYLNGTK